MLLYGMVLLSPLWAQTDGSGQGTGSQMEQRVSKLEKAWAAVPKVSGFINLRYAYDATSKENGFDVRRARLDFKGAVGEKMDYRLQLELAGSPKILDAYVTYRFCPGLGVQAGEFKVPFTLENQYGPADLETIDNSMAVTYLCNYSDLSGISANGRDVGLCLRGGLFSVKNYKFVDYALGVFNGNGINLKDNNNTKDFSGMLGIRPLKDFSLWGAYYNGIYTREKVKHKRERSSAGLEWKSRKTLFRSEYILGNTGGMKSEGTYALAGQYVHDRVQLLLKYDYFRRDKSFSRNREHDYLVGINYFPLKRVRLQANYVYKAKQGGKDVNYVAVQCFTKF